jgi:Sec-independent protein secretion pathway component TatC
MRYVIAIVVAVLFVMTAILFFAAPIASFLVRQFTFDSPDTVADLHAAAFLLTAFGALVLGFLVGWLIGRPFAGPRR